MNRHVFISYCRLAEDSAVVDELIAALGDFTCWRDRDGLSVGEDWEDGIARAIADANAMILVVSGETKKSPQVLVEYRLAKAREPRLPIILLLIEKCDVPFNLGNINACIWYEDRPRALGQLREKLKDYRDHPAPRAMIRDYLLALRQSVELKNVANYASMAGEGQVQLGRPSDALRPVVMRPEFLLRRDLAEQRREYEDLLPELHRSKRVLILGEPGIGKSSTLAKFADELAERMLNGEPEPIPLIIPLREWRGDVSWDMLVGNHLNALAPHYRQLAADGRFCFLLDGLNELPRDDKRDAKLKHLREFLGTDNRVVVTCRELDYRDEALRLDFDTTITIRPLDPERVLDFLLRYLINIRGETEGSVAAEDLFWKIAGGTDVKAGWQKWRGIGFSLNNFFGVVKRSKELSTHYSVSEGTPWLDIARSPGNLMRLAANPYMLLMFVMIYLDEGAVPQNRGALFDKFVFYLIKREEFTDTEMSRGDWQELTAKLEDLAWTMQRHAVKSGETRGGLELTIPRAGAISVLGGNNWLYRGASANFLEDGDPVRFTHQLLQEYFFARRMLAEIGTGRLDAHEFWPEECWWLPSGWEESAVLAAGMIGDKAGKFIDWLVQANPEVAAMALQRSGAEFGDDVKLKLREQWLPRMTDIKRYPQALARAAIGRALGSVVLSSGEPLDNRPGVGLRADGLPDIEWVPIPGGDVTLINVESLFKVQAFHIGRYAVTHRQFQVFIDAPDGYRNIKCGITSNDFQNLRLQLGRM